jgi:hypothetical protein
MRTYLYLVMMTTTRSALIAAAAAVFVVACSCRWFTDGSPSAKRRDQVANIVKAYYHRTGCAFHARGPLTIEQVERELIERYEASRRENDGSDVRRGFWETRVAQDWAKIKDGLRGEDELYYFISNRASWARLSGLEGYVVIRGDAVVDVFCTAIS